MANTLVLSFAAAVGVAFLPEAMAMPRADSRRSVIAFALHSAIIVFISLCVLLITGRVMFSAGMAVALVALLVGVSNAKYAALREPFVFTDLSLFGQLFAHPRLYLPFLSIRTVAAATFGMVAAISGYVAETPLEHRSVSTSLIAAGVCLALAYWLAACLPLTLHPSDDQTRHGFFVVFVAYLLNGMRPATAQQLRRALATGPFASGLPQTTPDVIVIQSESFFDPRRLTDRVRPHVLYHFDAVRRESFQQGELTVPAWGANTMRTEFAVLTGIDSAQLGYARFYPYAFVRRRCASLASWFKQGGYQTRVIHPYYADFFGRDRAFRHLQIDRFDDIRSFANAAHVGPYVADSAVADSIIAALDEPREKPALIFAMTMENHGPLHLESVQAGDRASFHSLGDDPRWHDLTVYLRHLANADAMLRHLTDNLRARRRETVLCFYGDHVPALSQVFRELGCEPARSEYFIWRNYGDTPATHEDLRAEQLGGALIRALEPSLPSQMPARTLDPMTER